MGSLKCFGLVTMQCLIVTLGLVASAAAQYLPYPYAAGYPLLPYAVPVAPFVAHPNGALVPLEPKDVVDARAEHLQAVADALKPAERKRRSADPQFLPYAAGYPFLPYAYAVAPFVAHPNGALVPLEPKDVLDARAEHLQAVADALNPAERKRGSADAQFLASPVLPYTAGYALPYAAGYPFLPYVAPFVAHPNGAVVPLEPKDVVDARAEHLQAVADALK